MTDWTAFAAITGVVLALFLALARLSEPAVSGGAPPSGAEADAAADVDDPAESAGPADPAFPPRPVPVDGGGTAGPDLSTDALLLNVALSQGLFGTLLVFAAWWTRVPLAALGLSPAYTPRLLGLGVGLGVVLWVVNHLAGRASERAGIEGGEQLRAALAPDSARGWVVLLVGALPLVALFEEFLFRAALVGALSAGFPVSPWLLAVGSSIAFALGHGAQGRVGVFVTGVLGFALAAGFLLTRSFLVVAVAHYLVNALEFAVHEGPHVGG